MSLSHSGFSFFSNPSGVIEEVTPHQLPIVIQQFLGVNGESHIIGETYGCDLRCEFRFQGYNNIALLRADKKTLEGKQGKLTGTLTQTISGSDSSYQQCTFLGFAGTGAPFLDGSGVHGWVQFGYLFWRQRKRG
jgi:hypothetical protein